MRAGTVAFFIASFVAGTALAQAPTVVPVQGFLADSAGVPIDTGVNITVRIYAGAMGGTALHEETQAVTPDAGTFTMYVGGGGTPVDLSLFRDNTTLYLGLTIGTDAEMVPRFLLGTAPYAGFAQYCGSATQLGSLGAADVARATHTHNWSDLMSIPADLADGDNVLTEAQVDAYANNNGYITGVAANEGLSGGGTTGDIGLSVSFAGSGAAATVSRSDHAHAGMGDITQVNAGPGLTASGCTAGICTMSVDFAAGGSATTVSRSDHAHAAELPTCAVGSVLYRTMAGWSCETVTGVLDDKMAWGIVETTTGSNCIVQESSIPGVTCTFSGNAFTVNTPGWTTSYNDDVLTANLSWCTGCSNFGVRVDPGTATAAFTLQVVGYVSSRASVSWMLIRR